MKEENILGFIVLGKSCQVVVFCFDVFVVCLWILHHAGSLDLLCSLGCMPEVYRLRCHAFVLKTAMDLSDFFPSNQP